MFQIQYILFSPTTAVMAPPLSQQYTKSEENTSEHSVGVNLNTAVNQEYTKSEENTSERSVGVNLNTGLDKKRATVILHYR